MYRYIHECDDCKVCTEFSSKHYRDNYKCPCKDKKPLLTIELQDETSVPKVFYKGEEITNKVNVSFDWDTSDARNPHGLTYAIEHIEIDNGQATVNRIERRCGDHAI